MNTFDLREKWILINKLLNMVRREAGVPIVPPDRNPYAPREERDD